MKLNSIIILDIFFFKISLRLEQKSFAIDIFFFTLFLPIYYDICRETETSFSQ